MIFLKTLLFFLILILVAVSISVIDVDSNPAMLDRLYFYSGWITLISLVASLFLPFKKYFGLFALIAGLIHLWIFVWVDFSFQWEFIYEELKQKWYIYVGMASLLLLVACGLGSFFRYFALKSLVYLSIILALIHIILILKKINMSYAISISIIAILVICKIVASRRKKQLRI